MPWLAKNEDALVFSGDEEGPGQIMNCDTCCESSVRIRHVRVDERVAFDFSSANGCCEIEGLISLEPIDEVTRVTIVYMWPPKQNPYARYFDLAMKLWLKRETVRSLENLQALVEGDE